MVNIFIHTELTNCPCYISVYLAIFHCDILHNEINMFKIGYTWSKESQESHIIAHIIS